MSSNVLRIALDPQRADARYAHMCITCHPALAGQIRSALLSSGRELATAATMDALRLPWPPLDEQLRIVGQAAPLDRRLEAQQRTLTKLRRLERGLAEDLLSGRVLPDQA